MVSQKKIPRGNRCQEIVQAKFNFFKKVKPKEIILRTKIYPIDRSVVSFKCGKKRCEVCKNVNKTENFTSLVTQKTYEISQRLHCDNKCSIYIFDV